MDELTREVICQLSRLTRNVLRLHEADRLLDEGLLRMMESEGLMDDVRLGLDTHCQDRHWLLVTSVEKHLQMMIIVIDENLFCDDMFS